MIVPIYMLSYDLNKEGKDYEGLYDALKTFPRLHVLDSTWYIESDWMSSEIMMLLLPHIDTDDRVVISQITKNTTVQNLTPEENEWLRTRLT